MIVVVRMLPPPLPPPPDAVFDVLLLVLVSLVRVLFDDVDLEEGDNVVVTTEVTVPVWSD